MRILPLPPVTTSCAGGTNVLARLIVFFLSYESKIFSGFSPASIGGTFA